MSTDQTIAGDLQALGAAHGHPRAAAPEPTLRGHHPITAREDVALAVRRSAARLRTARLSSRYAHRLAQAVTGVAALLAAVGLADFISDPASVVERRLNLAGPLGALAAVYLVTLAVAGRRLAGRRAAHEELEEAHARDRLARVDGWSTGLVVAGLSCLVPFLGAIVAGEPVWSHPEGAEIRIVDGVFGIANLGAVALAATVPALLLGGVIARRRGVLPAWLEQFASWRALGLAAGLAAVAIFLARRAAGGVATEEMSALGQLGRAVLAQLAITTFAVWAALRLRGGRT